MENDKIKLVSLEGRTANNLQFFLADMFEYLDYVSKREFLAAGLGDKPKVAAIKNMIKYGLIDFRKITKSIAMEEQITFGESCDKLLELILLVIDRTGEDSEFIDELISYTKNIEPRLNLNLKKFGIN